MNPKIINLSQYQIYINKRIGLGWHSSTYQYIDANNLNRQIVAKIYKNSKFSQEINVLKILEASHENIIKKFDIIQHDQDIIIIIEMHFQFQKSNPVKKRTESFDVFNYLRQLLQGYHYLNQQNFVIQELNQLIYLVMKMIPQSCLILEYKLYILGLIMKLDLLLLLNLQLIQKLLKKFIDRTLTEIQNLSQFNRKKQ